MLSSVTNPVLRLAWAKMPGEDARHFPIQAANKVAFLETLQNPVAGTCSMMGIELMMIFLIRRGFPPKNQGQIQPAGLVSFPAALVA
jgi:hypothetical protein